MLQARQLGTQLVVGIHSDESIMENKGPTVMTLEERYASKSSPDPRLLIVLFSLALLPWMPAVG